MWNIFGYPSQEAFDARQALPLANDIPQRDAAEHVAKAALAQYPITHAKNERVEIIFHRRTTHMKTKVAGKIKHADLMAMLKRLQKLSQTHGANSKEWNDAHAAAINTPARIEMPLGELTNAKIAGFVMVWRMHGKIQTAPIDARNQFNAQGLEGKAVVQHDLFAAMLVAQQVHPHRIAVYAAVPEGLK